MAKPWAVINGAVAWVLAAGAAVSAAPPVWLSTSLLRAQVAPQPANVHGALSNAIDCYRGGDYELAAELLRRVQVSQNELSPAEVNDLANYLRLNGEALKARREGADQVRAAEQAVRHGHPQEAAQLLKAVDANQYLAPADQTAARQLATRLHVRFSAPEESPYQATGGASKTAQPADSAANSQAPDARTLLTMAREAFQKGDLDLADHLATEAEKEAARTHGGLPGWMKPWSDSPAKVHRDVQTARLQKAAERGMTAEVKPQAPVAAEATSPPPAREPSSPFRTLKHFFAKGSSSPSHESAQPAMPTPARSPETPAATATTSYSVHQQETTPANAPAAPPPATANARQLLREGRAALHGGNLAQARQCAERARSLHPELNWAEDNPDKLLADVNRVESARAGARSDTAVVKTPAVSNNGKPADARKILRMGREAFAQGRLDEAEKMAHDAGTYSHVRWGLFEDNPDKLHLDIRKARQRHDQEQAVRVLAEARRLFADGRLAEAKTRAYEAQKLHGPYSMWDLGDRPLKLVNEIEAAEARCQKDRPRPADSRTLVKNDSPRPAAPRTNGPAVSAETQAAQAAQCLAAARFQLQSGNVAAAAQNVERVKQLCAGWDQQAHGPAPWEDTLFVMERDLQMASRGSHPDAGPATPPVQQVSAMVREAPVAGNMAREKARVLLAEARALQKAGQLVEARAKALEAQRTSTAFGPDEDRPEMALLELAGLCDRKIAGLLALATDCVTAAGTDPAHFANAEDHLRLAKQLSDGFGFDSTRVDNKLMWLQQTRAAVLGKSVAPVTYVPQTSRNTSGPDNLVKGTGPAPAGDAAHEKGQRLLEQARLELRHGQTAMARRMAVEAYNTPQYGVQTEAEKVLRSIDTEEFNQKLLMTNRACDASFAAFNRHDYAHAARIIAELDVKMLSVDRASRLKEIMMNAEMQPTALAQNGPRTGVARVSDQGNQPGPLPLEGPTGTGKATATDLGEGAHGPGGDLMARVVGMQEVKFQELHTRARQVQKEAMERFKAGDTDHALEMLTDFVEKLADSGLDQAQVTLLTRPIQARVQTLKTLKAQRDFERVQLAAGTNHNDEQRAEAAQERKKRDQVADLMKQYHTFYKEGKFHQANMLAQKALELDPENVAADAAVHISQMAERHQNYDKISKDKENMDLEILNDTDKVGASVVDYPIKFDQATSDRVKKRTDLGKGIWPTTHSAKERQIEGRLSAPITLNFKDQRLGQVIDDLHDLTGVNVVADAAALEESGVGLDRPLSLKVENISLKSALNLLLSQAHLTYVIKDEALQITTEDHAKGKLKRVTYPVADLVVPIENHDLPKCQDMAYLLGKQVDNGPQYNPGMPYTGPNTLFNGNAVSNPATGISSYPAGQAAPQATVRRTGNTIEDLLIKLITQTVSPESWSEVGGQGTIQYFPLGLALVINQTLDIQEQIQDLLEALRRLQDLEVSIEMRLLSVSESFFERIGVNFDVNIVNPNHKYDNNLLTTNFQPFGFINKFTPAGFVSGLTQANTLTPDLGVPIQQSSFAFSTPPFGYPYAIGSDGGLSLGLAFLSDIQVFMFMEAAQGDRRMNVMQAPRLTMFNGQTATLTVGDIQFFTVGLQQNFTPAGQLFFTPQNQPFPLGVSLTVAPVVSGDRRFVRMNLAPTLTNLANANVPLIPVQIPIPQTFDSGIVSNAQDRLFQMFLQQPTFTTISILTTVSVPDGGTVLIGGLKTLSEGRNEFGPPILSKIPYINRLFKNVGYGRDAQSLMIMVTPRIIINLEEEIRQTGGPGGVPVAPGGGP
jgi:type II secretory pathway component GspD/PulD (secretin)